MAEQRWKVPLTTVSHEWRTVLESMSLILRSTQYSILTSVINFCYFSNPHDSNPMTSSHKATLQENTVRAVPLPLQGYRPIY